ncbi:unnamed protein product [Symbiodinium microadriaticum]|nr:unnamed protein product [Symbiodinium microadriaticum]
MHNASLLVGTGSQLFVQVFLRCVLQVQFDVSVDPTAATPQEYFTALQVKGPYERLVAMVALEVVTVARQEVAAAKSHLMAPMARLTCLAAFLAFAASCAEVLQPTLLRRQEVEPELVAELLSGPRHDAHRHKKGSRGQRHGVKHHAISHLKVNQTANQNQGKDIPACGADYTCDEKRTESLGNYAKKHLAVYTYNIGSYEGGMREKNIPCVPQNVDAFLFLDHDTWERSNQTSLGIWKRRGWQIKSISLQAGTEFVTGARLTSKLLKFTPPSWLLNGQWDWLVEFDGNVVLDLLRVGPFLDKYSLKPLLLLDWSYHESCGEDGFSCFSHELKSMLHNRRQYIEDSKENIVAWQEKLTKEHQGSVPGTRKYTPPFYYETRIIFRNLRHARSADVSQAFGRTYEKCHEIQRDQFLLPYYLWHANLSFDTEAFPMTFLADSVGMCMVNTREGRN